MQRDTELKKSLQEIHRALHGGFATRAKNFGGTKVWSIVSLSVIALVVVVLTIGATGTSPVRIPIITDRVVSDPGRGLANANTQFDDLLPTDQNIPDIHVTAALVKELGAAWHHALHLQGWTPHDQD